MNRKKITATVFNRKVLLIWLALCTFGMTELLDRFPAATELLYANGLYRLIAPALSAVNRLVPFSLGDLFYLLLLLLLPLLLVLLFLRRIRFSVFLLTVLNTLAVVYLLFYWLWGFNYYRPELNQRLGITHRKVAPGDFGKVLETIVKRVNAEYVAFDRFDAEKIDAALELSYRQSASFLKLHYPAGSRRPKPILFSDFFAQAGISGYFGPFFNEVHLNSHLLPQEYPVVLGHEKAHQFGITSEAEANFYGWFACANSENRQLRYSGYLYLLQYFLWYSRANDEIPKLKVKPRAEVVADLLRIKNHWKSLRNETMDEISGQVNDAYLKTNKVEKGIEDYRGVVGFVMDFMTDPKQRNNPELKRLFAK